MIKKTPLCFIAAFFLFTAQLQAARADTADAPSYGDAIVVSSIGDARNLIPILATDSASSEICGMVFNGILKYDEHVNLAGDLAESWEVLDNGLTIIFHLRKGVRWHDGAPFTAADVEFTYRKLIDPAVHTPYGSDYERIRSFDIIDDHTFKVAYKEPFSPALSSWCMMVMPKHLLEKEDLNNSSFSRHPVGTGPYKFRRWKTAEKIELEANKDYFEGRPHINRYIYRIIPDESTIFLELQTQGVDLAQLTPLQYTRQTETPFFKDHYQKFAYPGFGYSYMAYNLNDPKFADKRVRQAINYAVDKDEIVKTVFFGLARVTTGPFMMDSWAYNRDVRPVPCDPEKARSLLSESGWHDTNGDGWLDKNGSVFEFTVLLNQGNAERLRAAEMVQRSLKKIGIRMKIRALEWSALINEYINKRRFEAVMMGWFLTRDPDNFDIWHSSKTKPGEFNFVGYNNKEVDDLLIYGRRIFDLEKRREIYHRIHEIIYDDQPYLFLYNAETLPIVHKRFRGVRSSPIGIGYNFVTWYVMPGEERYGDH